MIGAVATVPATGENSWFSVGWMPTPSPSVLEAKTLSSTSVTGTTMPATGAPITTWTPVSASAAAAGMASDVTESGVEVVEAAGTGSL